MVVPWWYWGCVNLYSAPTTTTKRTTFHHPIHSYWGATFVPPPQFSASGRLLVVPLPRHGRFRCRVRCRFGKRVAGLAVGPWGSRLSLHRAGPGGDGALPGGEDPRLPQVARMKMGTGVGSQEVDQSYVVFPFWRGEYVRAHQWENLWKPNIFNIWC